MLDPETREAIERFMQYVDILPNGCWFWTGARSRGKGNKKWYGSFWYKGESIRAHRFSCDVIGGKVCPPGWHRDHTCKFSLCVCPDHVEPVTSQKNQELKVERIESMGLRGAKVLGDSRVSSLMNFTFAR